MLSNNKQKVQSFLQKFQGRKNAVKKDGLIHLLQQKLQRPGGNPKAILSNRNINSKKMQPQNVVINKKQLSPLNQLSPLLSERQLQKGSKSQRYVQRKQETSSQQLPTRKNQIQQLIQLKNQQFIVNKLRLPSINKTETSSTHKVQSQANKQAHEASSRTKAVPRRSGYSQSVLMNNFDKIFQLDSYALKHLQCLNKFEKILIKQKADNNTRSVLQQSK